MKIGKRRIPGRSYLLISLLVAAAALPAAAHTPTGGDIFKSWIGKALRAETAKGVMITLVFSADGTASMSGGFSDTGWWRATDDGYCTSWKESRRGQEVCYSVVSDGGVFLVRVKSTGELSGRVTPP